MNQLYVFYLSGKCMCISIYADLIIAKATDVVVLPLFYGLANAFLLPEITEAEQGGSAAGNNQIFPTN